jgi:hypothetical protein
MQNEFRVPRSPDALLGRRSLVGRVRGLQGPGPIRPTPRQLFPCRILKRERTDDEAYVCGAVALRDVVNHPGCTLRLVEIARGAARLLLGHFVEEKLRLCHLSCTRVRSIFRSQIARARPTIDGTLAEGARAEILPAARERIIITHAAGKDTRECCKLIKLIDRN